MGFYLKLGIAGFCCWGGVKIVTQLLIAFRMKNIWACLPEKSTRGRHFYLSLYSFSSWCNWGKITTLVSPGLLVLSFPWTVCEERRATEDEMVGWHHQFNGPESEQTSRDNEGQGSLVCCSPGGYKEPEMTEWVNWTYLTLYTKVKVLNTRPETIKLLKENRGKDFMILEYAYNTSNVFLDVTRNA